MSVKSIIYMVLSILLGAYLVVGLTIADMQAAQEKSYGVIINRLDSSNNFVEAKDVNGLIKEVEATTKGVEIYSLHLQDIEDHLNNFPNIEWANVSRLYKGDRAYIYIEVMAMQPVARIVDDGKSYYINKEGKKLLATYNYRVKDVPVLVAHIDSAQWVKQMPRFLPLFDYIKTHKTFREFATAYKIEDNGDIILQPIISNHVINLGDASILDNKMQRLKIFYREVVSKKGWEYYDTISVKWKGQVVATKRTKASMTPEYIEETDSVAMLETSVDNVEVIPESNMTTEKIKNDTIKR